MHSTNSYHMPTNCPGLCRAGARLDDGQTSWCLQYELHCVSVQRKGFGRRHAPTSCESLLEADSSGRATGQGVRGMAGYKDAFTFHSMHIV